MVVIQSMSLKAAGKAHSGGMHTTQAARKGGKMAARAASGAQAAGEKMKALSQRTRGRPTKAAEDHHQATHLPGEQQNSFSLPSSPAASSPQAYLHSPAMF